MKIGVDIRVLMDEQYSGISEYTAKLLSAIKKDNLNAVTPDNYRLFYNSGHDLSSRMEKWAGSNAELIATHWTNKIFNYVLQKVFGWPKLDQVLGGVDLFWSPHFNFSCLSNSKSGLKKVITVHDLSFLRYPEFFSGRKNFWHRALNVKRTLREADMIVAVSENTKNDIVALAGISPEKIRVIYSGNNISKKEWPAEQVANLLIAKGISGRFMLYVGNIEPRKNIAGLIKAYDVLRRNDATGLFKDLNLVLAGAPGWKNKEIYAARHKSPFKDQIIFTGYVSDAEKEILYAQATVFAYPSFYEGFGFPPLEAMTYGVPVVCSNVSSLPEIVAKAGIMVDPFNPADLAEALRLVLTDNILRADLIAAGYNRAAEFSWEKAAQAYRALFNELYETK